VKKQILSEQALYYGDVKMPAGFEINRDKLSKHILEFSLDNKSFKFSKDWDKLNTYIKEHIFLNYNIRIINQTTFGNYYKSNELTLPLLGCDLLDLKNSSDFTLLYGVDVNQCLVRINYDNNRIKNQNWDIELKNNMFIMFPSTNSYIISNHQKENLNFILTIRYKDIINEGFSI